MFEWLHLLADRSDVPAFCPQCGTAIDGVEPAFVPKAPRIGSVDSAEAVYRAMESSSAANARAAAEQLGVSESEMAHMKITDLKDNLREGDIAAVTRPNPTSTFMQQNAGVVTQAQIAGAQFAANTRVGPYPGAGDHARQTVSSMHSAQRAMLEATGKRG